MASRIMIFGQGRSGTNWLCSCFDHSRYTWCRNEPNEIDPFCSKEGAFPTVIPKHVDHQQVAAWFHRAGVWERNRGIRDHILPVNKTYLRSAHITNRIAHGHKIVYKVLHKPRRLAQIPIFEVEKSAQWNKRINVIKINKSPAIASFAGDHLNDTTFVHIIRHPCGYINSWANRWLRRNSHDSVLEANIRRLELVTENDHGFADRMPDIYSMSAIESEFWYWLYSSESIHTALRSSNLPFYEITYESLIDNYSDELHSIYRKCSLDTEDLRRAVLSEKIKPSSSVKDAWKDRLDSNAIRYIENHLDDSPLSPLWE